MQPKEIFACNCTLLRANKGFESYSQMLSPTSRLFDIDDKHVDMYYKALTVFDNFEAEHGNITAELRITTTEDADTLLMTILVGPKSSIGLTITTEDTVSTLNCRLTDTLETISAMCKTEKTVEEAADIILRHAVNVIDDEIYNRWSKANNCLSYTPRLVLEDWSGVQAVKYINEVIFETENESVNYSGNHIESESLNDLDDEEAIRNMSLTSQLLVEINDIIKSLM